jgi:hypothetical protein
MKFRSVLMIASMIGALSVTGCGDEQQATGGAGGVGGIGGSGGGRAVGGIGGIGGSAGSAGSGGSEYQVCTLGLCMEDEAVGASCLEVYDRCVGQGHYPRSCRMDADMTCGVFGETGPY